MSRAKSTDKAATAEAVAKMAEASEKMVNDEAATNNSIDVSEWMDEPDEPDNPLIVGLIEMLSMIAIVGPAKAAKSWLAMQIAVCVAAGLSLLGFATKRHRVYVANVEISGKQYKKRLRSMCAKLGVDPRDLKGWLFVDNLKGREVTFDSARAEAKRRGCDVVIIDNFYRIFKGEETKELDCKAALDDMGKFYADGLTLFVVFHAPKGFSGDRQIVDMISGSSTLVRYPENVIAILPHAKDHPYRVVDCSILRDYPPPDPFTVKLEDGALEVDADVAPELKTARRNGVKMGGGSPESKAREFQKKKELLAEAVKKYVADKPLVTMTKFRNAIAATPEGQSMSKEDRGLAIDELIEDKIVVAKTEKLERKDDGRIGRVPGKHYLVGRPDRVRYYPDDFKGGRYDGE